MFTMVCGGKITSNQSPPVPSRVCGIARPLGTLTRRVLLFADMHGCSQIFHDFKSGQEYSQMFMCVHKCSWVFQVHLPESASPLPAGGTFDLNCSENCCSTNVVVRCAVESELALH